MLFSKYIDTIKNTETILCTGRVTRVQGMLVESRGPQAVIGEICMIQLKDGASVLAEVVGLDGTLVQLTAYGETKGIEIGGKVTASGSGLMIPVGDELLGRIIDATGHAYDGKGEIASAKKYPAQAPAPSPLERTPQNKRIVTGVRAIDSLLAVAKGQRLGIFAGSGVGKSTLMSMIARNTNADVNVIALIGERGREVMDFINRDLGEAGLKRSVVVAATSDQPSVARLRGAYTATAVAEYFRDQGKDVMLLFDSVTRFAHAQREIGLAAGEPPAQRGYPPSVFDLLPKLLERSGTNKHGSITAFYTVLVDGDDMDEPIADKVRGTLDGHIVLSRRLAQEYHYPAIDIPASVSRLSKRVSGKKTQEACAAVRRLMAAYAGAEDMISVGAYQKGSNPAIDAAIDAHEDIEALLTQEEFEDCPLSETLKKLGAAAHVDIPESEFSDAANDAETERNSVSVPPPPQENSE
ncbi:MAG: FliI/YscN family ATPase [Bacteroides sp.]|nr:FliI/YscN family ATPase [Prevotella sp.]MCM1407421.1 FliI/YscN family ATPase [Treponema brennaborense]MCM1469911.1 FliI/YscN family ATPase [Bacteroides sp.]